MKGIKVSEVTGALIQDATRALFNHQLGPSGGRGVGPFEESETESQFLRDLNRHVTYNEGLRYGTAVWCHTKWRYILRDANGERPGWSDAEDLYFFFVLHANAPHGTTEGAKARECCGRIAADLTAAGFPTIAED